MKYYTIFNSFVAYNTIKATVYDEAVFDNNYNGNAGTLFRERPVNAQTRATLLQAHNELRDDAASGYLNNQKRATKLPALQWDDDLEKSAQLYANKCNWQHSKPSGFKALPYNYGENMYITSAFGVHDDPTLAVTSWGNEHEWYNHISHQCDDNKQCAHYTQMVSENTKRVGCGIAECVNVDGIGWGGGTFIVCQYYPPGRQITQDPYTYAENSEATGEDCLHGTHSLYNSLCKDQNENTAICDADVDRCPASGTCEPNSSSPKTKFNCDCLDDYEGKWCEQSACVEGVLEDVSVGQESWVWENGQPVYFQDHEKQLAVDYCDSMNDDNPGSCAGLARRKYVLWYFWYPLSQRTSYLEEHPGGSIVWSNCGAEEEPAATTEVPDMTTMTQPEPEGESEEEEDESTFDPSNYSLDLKMVGLDGKIRLGADYDGDINNKCIGLDPTIRGGQPKPWHYNSLIKIQDCVEEADLPYEYDHQAWIYDESEGTICTGHQTANMVQKNFRYCILSNYKQGGNRPLKLMALEADEVIRYGFQFDFEAGQIVGRHSNPKEVVCWKDSGDDLWVKKMKTNSHFGSIQMEFEML